MSFEPANILASYQVFSFLALIHRHCGALSARHSLRVGVLADRYARLRDDRTVSGGVLFQAGCLHDLGKMRVGAALLDAPRPLSALEWREVRTHPARGARPKRRSIRCWRSVGMRLFPC